jgi:PAS domain S-box-containing protein
VTAPTDRLCEEVGARRFERDPHAAPAMNGGERTADPSRDASADPASLARQMLGHFGVQVLVFDHAMRILLAAGHEFDRLGPNGGAFEGRLIDEAVSTEEWAAVGTAYHAALHGITSKRFYARRGRTYSVRVMPLAADGGIAGAMAVAQDLTAQHRLESAVSEHEAGARNAERILASAFDRAPIGMAMIDLNGDWLRVNAAYCSMLGYERAEMLKQSFAGLTHPDDAELDVEWMRSAVRGESDSLEREERQIAHDGSIVWVELRAEVIRDDFGRPACTLTVLQNITERRRADIVFRTSERWLRSVLANTPAAVFVKGRDHRYQLANNAFEQRFDLEPGWILGRGDEALPAGAVAQDRETDEFVLRTGTSIENEQAVVHDGETHIYHTIKFALRDEHERSYAICGIVNDITDRKRREDELEDRLRWTDRIRDAAAGGRFLLYGQPIISLATGVVEQAELLIRMFDRRRSSRIVPPAEFLPAAERFDLVALIDQWVVTRAIELANAGHRVEVNLSGKTVSDAAARGGIERLVATTAVHPENIIFEITETAAAQNIDSARRFVERLRILGCRFALDDFGVGFGAFTYLKLLPVDYLKIDLQFIRDLVRDVTSRRVVEAIVAVAKAFGIETVAEGVEDQPTLDLLAPLGVDCAQGFWIGRPVPVDELWVPARDA